MRTRDAAAWLVDSAGPAIRYRTACELLGEAPDPKALLDSALVQRWLARIVPPAARKTIHGSRADQFENAIGKLAQLGVKAGAPELDRAVRSHLEWLKLASEPAADWYPHFERDLVANALSAAGYRAHPTVRALVLERLDRVAVFCRKQRYDIYVDRSDYRGIPTGFRGRPLVDPALHTDGRLPLPTIWDLVAASDLRMNATDGALRSKLDAIVRYVLTPEYQELPESYGILRAGPSRYWAIGWDVKLPGHRRPPRSAIEHATLLMRLELLAPFPSARRCDWFKRSLQVLSAHRTPRGTYAFPRKLLPEKQSGYWVLGAYTGLEENRRTHLALELESTFRMLRIRQLAAA